MANPLYHELAIDAEAFFAEPGADRAASQQLANERLNTQVDVETLIHGLNSVDTLVDETDDATASRAFGAMVLATLARPDSLPHLLTGYAYAYATFYKLQNVDHGTMNVFDPCFRTYEHSFGATLDTIGVDRRTMINGFHYDDFEVRTNLTNLAYLLEAGGNDAARELRLARGISLLGRFTPDLLLEQYAGLDVEDTRAHLPVYVSAETNNDFIGDPLYDVVHDFALSNEDIRPMFYEICHPYDLVKFMAAAKNPAFGIMSAHGSYESITLGDDDYAFIDGQTVFDPEYLAAARKAWRRSGGMVLATCNNIFRKPGYIDPACKISEDFRIPVIGSRDEIATVSLERDTEDPSIIRAALANEWRHTSGTDKIIPSSLTKAVRKWQLQAYAPEVPTCPSLFTPEQRPERAVISLDSPRHPVYELVDIN